MDSVGEGEGGKIWENGIETCVISCMKLKKKKKKRLHTPNAGGLGSILGQGTRLHRPQLRVYMLQLKISNATVKIKDPACLN